jgi:hypothetical protein
MELNGTYISSLIVENFVRDFDYNQFPKVFLISKEWYEVYKKVLDEKIHKQISVYASDGTFTDLHIGKMMNVLRITYKIPGKELETFLKTEYVLKVSNIHGTLETLYFIFDYFYKKIDKKYKKKYFKHRIIIYLIIVEYFMKIPDDEHSIRNNQRFVDALKAKSSELKKNLKTNVDKKNIKIINKKLNNVINL